MKTDLLDLIAYTLTTPHSWGYQDSMIDSYVLDAGGLRLSISYDMVSHISVSLRKQHETLVHKAYFEDNPRYPQAVSLYRDIQISTVNISQKLEEFLADYGIPFTNTETLPSLWEIFRALLENNPPWKGDGQEFTLYAFGTRFQASHFLSEICLSFSVNHIRVLEVTSRKGDWDWEACEALFQKASFQWEEGIQSHLDAFRVALDVSESTDDPPPEESNSKGPSKWVSLFGRLL